MDLATRKYRLSTGPPRAARRFFRWRQGRKLTALTVCCVLSWLGAAAHGQDPLVVDPQKEYNVKGAYLYSFGRYATWPASAFVGDEEPFVIGVLGSAPLDPILERISTSKTIQGRRIDVRTYRTAEETGICHILFVARTVPPDVQQAAIERHRQSAVLLIGETPGFTQWGGVINFFLEEESVRFEINVTAARERQISIDAKLLRLARLHGQE
jgi:hypothetical protein